jgi:hypothetical protein
MRLRLWSMMTQRSATSSPARGGRRIKVIGAADGVEGLKLAARPQARADLPRRDDAKMDGMRPSQPH